MDGKRYKNLPIGVSDFRDVIASDFYYVDKTMFIQRLLDYQARIILFTRPRRFGKSLALDMLHRFFACDEQEGNRALFAGLAVTQSVRHMAEQGKYPVVHINFNGAKYSDWQQAQAGLADYLTDLLCPYDYLQNSAKIAQSDKDKLLLIRTHKADPALLRNSLRFLCDLLYRHHGQPVVLLIDEYDVPIQSAYQNGYYNDMIDFMRAFMTSGLKDNPTLRLAVLTGVMRIAKDSLFSGLNNLVVDTILSEDYADCFGFTQSEVEAMARYYDRPDAIPELQSWYDGYRFGEQDMYNPWSVLRYFSNRCKAQAYWIDTASNDLTIEFLRRLEEQQREAIWTLYRGGTVEAALDTSVSYRQLDDSQADIVFSLMAMTGYLKPVEELGCGYYALQVPNAEVNTIFATEIIGYMERTYNITELYKLWNALRKNDSAAFEAKLRDILSRYGSYYDGQEAFYHGFMMCLLLGLDARYKLLSNREAGLGRADIMLQPRLDKSLPGFIFELKRSDKAEGLDLLAESALGQIEAKRYADDFSPDIREVRCYGIAFCKKECALRTRSIVRPAPVGENCLG